MKKSTMLLFLLCLFTFAIFRFNYCCAEERDYYINDLNIDVKVNNNKQCVVKEKVNVHFNKKVNEFYKTIKTEIEGEYVNVSNVKVNGEKFHTTDGLYDYSIVIENKDTGFSGDNEFIIEYTIDYYKRKDNKNDIFNFDVLQDTYCGDIKNFSEKINMPSKINEENITLSSGRYNAENENELNVKYKIDNNTIEISKAGSIERGCSIKLKADLDKGTFKDIADFKYNYVIKDKEVDIHITKQQEYYITQKYSIDILNENADGNYLRLMSAGSSLDKIYDFKSSSNVVTFNSFHDTAYLPKKKGLIEFTVSYKQKPALDSDLKFSIYSGSKYVNLEKMNFKINSDVKLKDCDVDCDDDIKGKISVNKSQYNITIKNNDEINTNGMIDAKIDADKGKFTRPMNTSAFIKFLCAAVCFFVSLYAYKKYCSTEQYEIENRYYAPEFIDSLKAGYIFNGEFSKKNTASLIFYWYTHNHIDIVSSRNSDGYYFRIIKLSELDDDQHKDYEKEMFAKLFAESSEVTVNKKNGSLMMYKLYSSIKKSFIKNIADEHMNNEKPAILKYIINFTMYLSFAALVYDRVSEGSDVEVKFIIYLILGGLVTGIYSYLMKRCSIVAKRKGNGETAEKYSKIFLSIPFFFIICFMFIYKTTPFIVTFMTILFLFVSIAVKDCPLRGNNYFEEKLCYLLGLHDFLAEKEITKLDMLFYDDSEYYFKVLPFAIALGEEKHLMDRVKKLSEKNFDEEKIYDFYILNCIFNNRNIMV